MTKQIASGLFFFLSLFAAARADALPEFKHVVIVILENTNYEDALRQPFMAKLAAQGGLLTQFYAETHPSQPNYLALIAGDTMSVTDDDNHTVTGNHLGTLLERTGKQWKVYAEGWPGNCFRGARKGAYVRKHNPFISFNDVQLQPSRCARIVDASELDQDVDHQTLPEVALYIPDLNNDGHDTGVAYADRFLKKRFEAMLSDPHFRDVTFIVTFDESALTAPQNHIYTVVTGYGVRPGTISPSRYNHYSLLRTLELAFRLGDLGRHDVGATAIGAIWK